MANQKRNDKKNGKAPVRENFTSTSACLSQIASGVFPGLPPELFEDQEDDIDFYEVPCLS